MAATYKPKWTYEYDDLATYNAECARGIMHTYDYDQLMKAKQQSFDKRLLE